MPLLNNISQLRNVEWSKSFLWDIEFKNPVKAVGKKDTDSPKAFPEQNKLQKGAAILSKAGDGSLTLANRLANKVKDTVEDFVGIKKHSIPLASDNNPSWYPITDFTDSVANITTKSFTGTYRGYSIPIGSEELQCSITFIDDMNNTMFSWAKKWLRSCVILDPLNGFEYVATLDDIVKNMTVTKFDNRYNIIETSTYSVFPFGELSYNGKSEDSLNSYTLKLIKAGVSNETVKGDEKPFRYDILASKYVGGVRRGIS